MLVNATAGLEQDAPQADHIVERMEVSAAAVDQAAMIERGSDLGMERGRIEQAGFAVTIGFELVSLARQRLEMGRFRSADDMTLRQVAIDPVRGDPLSDQRLAFLGNSKADLGLAPPEQTLELAHAGRKACAD